MPPKAAAASGPRRYRSRPRAAAFPGEDPMSLRTPEELCDLFLELASPACQRNGEVVEAR